MEQTVLKCNQSVLRIKENIVKLQQANAKGILEETTTNKNE